MSFGKEAPPLPMYERKVLRHVPTMVRRRYDPDLNSNFDATQGMYSKHSNNESGGAKDDANLASIVNVYVEDKFVDDGHAKFDDDHGSLCLEDCKDEDNGIVDGNTHEYIVDVSVRNIQGLHIEDSESEGDGTVVDVDVEDKIEDDGQAIFFDDQGLLAEDGKSKGDETKAANVASYYVDISVRDKVQDNELIGNFDNKQGSQVEEDCKIKSDGSIDAIVVSAIDQPVEIANENFDDKQEFIQGALENTVEQDGYDLRCPICKQYFTQTMILRRREDRQPYKTTCFSSLDALFCSNRW
ncbi:uncharacterized protein LOC110733394 isoform X2 [Chenopodium quinoa]|uniref:uncharacterized protein LOC110733394 isoform X2 n=1 Tax=Chenopodium quinoa TaxID=63459 RepID=UPI000B775723|nr:uncharacterized protein LOC110733394 isoform X2 [Chenopodium quinoa]